MGDPERVAVNIDMTAGNLIGKIFITVISTIIALGLLAGGFVNPGSIYELRILQAIYFVGAAVVFILGLLPWAFGWEEFPSPDGERSSPRSTPHRGDKEEDIRDNEGEVVDESSNRL